MTDLETMKDMLTRAGVVFKIESEYYPDCIEISVHAKDGPSNEGYSGFVATMQFSKEGGNLVTVGAWE